jgi:RND family efflux transporter MFP subunit
MNGALVAIAVLTAAACSGTGAKEAEPAAAAAPPVLEIGGENTLRVDTGEVIVGPVVSGTLTPLTQATVRAELGGAVLRVSAEQGQAVRKGQVLASIEAPTQDDAVRSAESSVRSEVQNLEQAQREVARAESLVKAGAIASRDVENARNAVITAESRVADARARLSSARKGLADATVVSPISGIVADRPVNTGDVVAPGTPLYTIVDPASMQLEASVPSESLAAVRVGATVQFSVRGYPDQAFVGRIERISPTADPVTRQVPIWVSVDNRGGRLVGGLFAEGRVTQEARKGLVVPLSVVNEDEGAATVLRVADGKVDRVPVTLGLRDPQTERVVVTSGLEAGDILLRGVAQGITPGTRVTIRNQS